MGQYYLHQTQYIEFLLSIRCPPLAWTTGTAASVAKIAQVVLLEEATVLEIAMQRAKTRLEHLLLWIEKPSLLRVTLLPPLPLLTLLLPLYPWEYMETQASQYLHLYRQL